MQQAASSPADDQALLASTNARGLLEGIARKLQVAATYNAMAVHIAPHVLYTRADMLYLGGIVTRRRGEAVRAAKLSVFKVDGLSDLAVLAAPFQIDPAFAADDPRYAATTIFAVDPAAT